MDKIRRVIEKHARIGLGISVRKNLQHKRVKYVMTFKMKEGVLVDEMLDEFTELEGIE